MRLDDKGVRVATPDEPMPHTALLEQSLAAMAEVQERVEPGFAPDVAIIPAEDWRAFIDSHAEILLLWTAWRDSPYRDRTPPDGVASVVRRQCGGVACPDCDCAPTNDDETRPAVHMNLTRGSAGEILETDDPPRCKPCNETGAIHCQHPDECGGPWTVKGEQRD